MGAEPFEPWYYVFDRTIYSDSNCTVFVQPAGSDCGYFSELPECQSAGEGYFMGFTITHKCIENCMNCYE